MNMDPDMPQSDLLKQVVNALTGLGSPEERIDLALALLGHEPVLSEKTLKGQKTKKGMPVLIGRSPVMEALEWNWQRTGGTKYSCLEFSCKQTICRGALCGCA